MAICVFHHLSNLLHNKSVAASHGITRYLRNISLEHYCRRWLLSTCAYKNEQQGNMRLIKNMRLTASVCLIERA